MISLQAPLEPILAAHVLRYVALGDSYTIGTGVEPGSGWPDQLADRIRSRGIPLRIVANLGVNGYATADLIRDELPALSGLRPDFATLLIGANDVVQGVPAAVYGSNVERILTAILDLLPADRVVTVTTPDYTVTPAGADYGAPAARAASIRAFNGLLADASRARGVANVDIHDISLAVAGDRSLVATDGLHPSASQYRQWVDRLEPTVARLLEG